MVKSIIYFLIYFSSYLKSTACLLGMCLFRIPPTRMSSSRSVQYINHQRCQTTAVDSKNWMPGSIGRHWRLFIVQLTIICCNLLLLFHHQGSRKRHRQPEMISRDSDIIQCDNLHLFPLCVGFEGTLEEEGSSWQRWVAAIFSFQGDFLAFCSKF
jgi:hypothetical protein